MSRTLATATVACYFALVLICATLARGATLNTLHHREHRQMQTLHRYHGTVRFFRHHPRLARTAVGRREIRKARIWIGVTARELRETRLALRPPRPVSVQGIIAYVFGPNAGAALNVARCESGYSVNAVNGQYFGVFQMGSHERAIYGGSSTDPWQQVQAAYRYFVAAGGWGPWQCRP